MSASSTTPLNDGLDVQARREAERIVGTPFTNVERVARGYSRASYRASTAEDRMYAIRVAPPDGPMTGTELSLSREAAFIRALAGTSLPVPQLHGIATDGSLIVTDWAPGRPGVQGMDENQRELIYRRYIETLAELHLVELDHLDVPGADVVDPTEAATRELAVWRRVLAAKVSRPRPLAWFGLEVLANMPPPVAQRLVVCHGDPGPANFLHDGKWITALLDWEFAHVGDPIDDLAWWAVRGHELTGGCGDFEGQIARWSATTGLDVPTESLNFYRAFTALRFYISLVVMLENASGVVDRALPLRVLDQVGELLPRLLAEVLGADLLDYEAPAAGSVDTGRDAIEVIRTALSDVALPVAPSREVHRRLSNAIPVLGVLERALGAGASATEERAELSALLDRHVNDVADGHRALLDLVGDPDRRDELLVYFWRSGKRTNALWNER